MALQETPVILPGHDFETVTETVAEIPLSKRFPLGWIGIFLIALGGAGMLHMALGYLLLKGIGIWGNNIPVGWAFDIINFVWWIGIGHAGTLISAILLLFKQQWRMSISRFAEAMTIFAVVCAAIFPVFHTGRPWLAAYWLFPYPNAMGLWPQFKSPLIWDVFAVSTYATVSIVFWYIGMIPDLATLRDRAVSKVKAVDLRHPVARLARLRAPLAPLRSGDADSRGPVDAAGAVGAHGRQLRLRGVADSRLARDDLPALLRRRRHLRRLRDGADAGDSGAPLLRHGKPDHDAAHRQHGQDHAGDGPDRRLRLRDGSVLRVVQRQPARAVHDVQPHVRAVRLVVLDADRDQRRDDPAAVVQEHPHQHRGCCSSCRCSSASACGSSASSSS